MAIPRPASPFWRFMHGNSLLLFIGLLALGTLVGQCPTG